MKKILLITSNNINNNPRPNRLLNFLLDNNYSLDLLNYNKSEREVKQYYFKKKMNIDLVNIILYTRLYKLFNDLLLFNNVSQDTFKELQNNNYDLIICENIELIYLTLKLKSKNTKVMLDLREYFPSQFQNRFFWRIRKKAYYTYLLNNFVKQSDKLITVSDGIASEYKKHFNLDCETYLSLPEKGINKSELKDNYDKIKLVHHGNATPERNIESMIKMMDYLDPDKYSLDLYLVKSKQYYYDELNLLIKNKKNIRILNPVPFEDINTMLVQYDIGIFFFFPTTFNLLNCLPNKLFEFIQAGLCLAFGPTPEISKIVNEYKLGILSDNYDPENLARQIQSLNDTELNNFKNNSRLTADIFNIDNNNIKMKSIIDGLLN